MDLRSSGIQLNKKSFMSLEITLFLKDSFEFKSQILKEKIKKIAKSVYQDELLRSEYFQLSKSKSKNI